MAVTNQMRPLPLASFTSASVTGDYQPINPGGFPSGVVILRIINNSDEDVLISYDGTTDHDFLGMGASAKYQFQTNSQPNTNIARLSAGTMVYVKGTAGTGDIYLVSFYQPQAN